LEQSDFGVRVEGEVGGLEESDVSLVGIVSIIERGSWWMMRLDEVDSSRNMRFQWKNAIGMDFKFQKERPQTHNRDGVSKKRRISKHRLKGYPGKS
jgi:hypothetical protein